ADDATYSTHRFPSALNPAVGAAEIAAARRAMPAWLFQQEFLAEFVDTGDAVFPAAEVDAIVDDALPVGTPYDPARTYVDGWDLAKHIDWTVGITLDTTETPATLVAFDRFQRVPWPVVDQRIAERQAAYGSTVWIDSTGVGDVTLDHSQVPSGRMNGFRFTARSKTELLVNLQAMIEKRQVRIPPIGQLVAELKNYRWEDKAIPETDSVMALALAAWGVASRKEVSIRWV
ncbi:MAG: hypothetical protein QGH59_07970, partial [Gemmatimonadota bacterium]|nr:hypothetical protein [Gemmatimonadota bacterium]